MADRMRVTSVIGVTARMNLSVGALLPNAVGCV
jgi:hypothetical protein